MARKRNALPSYLLHKSSGQARVRINGRDHLLGPYGSDESRIRYGKLIAKLNGGIAVDPVAASKRGTVPRNESADPGPSVGELCLIFLRHAESYYVKNGKQTSEIHILKSVIRPLNQLYGLIPAREFGPLALKAVRERMVQLGWTRGTVNAAMSRIRRIFKHAVAHELIEPSVLQKLQALPALLAGRTEAPDNPPRAAVSDEDIQAVRKAVTPAVRDLIDLQLLTGATSGEILSLTMGAIDRTERVWLAKLTDHKTQHHGQSRVLHFGPRAQLILRRYIVASPDAKLFNMTGAGYRRAITRACEKLEIQRWVPHQLRHTAATTVRDEFGLEHAQAVLGHSKTDMTEHYAKAGQSKAREVAARLG